LGIGDAVLRAVVVADEPGVAVVRLVEPAGDAIELGGHEAGRGLVRIPRERGLDELPRGIVVAALELEPGRLGAKGGGVRVLVRGGGEEAERLGGLPDRAPTARDPDRRDHGLAGFQPRVSLASLLVVAREEKLPGRGGFALGARGAGSGEEEQPGDEKDGGDAPARAVVTAHVTASPPAPNT